MYRILSSELNLFAQELRDCLSPAVLQDIAKSVGFIKRASKYQSNELIALCVEGGSEYEQETSSSIR